MLTRNDAPPCTPRAVVVGGGFGGIAAALRLRAKGYRVTLVERLAAIGGRAQVFERDGFRHDAGPTVITAPFLFDELFELFGKRRADYVRFVPLEPWYRFRFDDGDTFDYCGTIEGTLAEIRRISPGDVDGYLRLVAHSKELCDVGFTGLAAEPFHKPSTMIRQIPSLARLRTYRTVWQLVSAYLSHPKLRQAFSIQPLLVGGNPFDTTSIYGLIHYLERKWGVFFAMGGTGALVAAFERLMREEGIEIRCETTVAEIAVEGRRATGVVLEDGARIAADVVVSNADPMHLYRNMVPDRVQSLVPSSGWRIYTIGSSMPRIRPADYRLQVVGHVGKPVTLTLAGLIAARAAERRATTLDYLRQEGLCDALDYALVDVGWSLRSQRALGRLLTAAGAPRELRGYYFGVSATHIPLAGVGQVHAFITPPGSDLASPLTAAWLFRSVLLVEHLFTVADHPTARGYRAEGTRVRSAGFRSVRDGALGRR